MEITGAAYPITSGGGQMPDGLIGYNVYRDGAFIAFVSGADTTWYYDLNLDPDNYEYAVTAKYDLTDYGFPGQFDESMIEGPETVSIMCGRPLPFYEPWDQATFAYNDWTFGPSQGNQYGSGQSLADGGLLMAADGDRLHVWTGESGSECRAVDMCVAVV
jgi:hypothetical protein